MEFSGIQKLSLLDVPDKLCCTLFTGGCNLRCPFCHNASLVLAPKHDYSLEQIHTFLKSRVGILDAVCITGGEPLLHPGLLNCMKEIKELGYFIKLDTNGCYPEKLQEMLDSGVVDYVAMDVKNAPSRYAETVGIVDFSISNVERSMEILRNSTIPFEFRTTIVAEFHTETEMEEMGRWLKPGDKLYLQKFVDSKELIERVRTLNYVDDTKMQEYQKILTKYGINVLLRGM